MGSLEKACKSLKLGAQTAFSSLVVTENGHADLFTPTMNFFRLATIRLDDSLTYKYARNH